MNDSDLDIKLAKVEQKVEYLERDFRELKEQLKEVNSNIVKKGEEIKDSFFEANSARQKLDEYIEAKTDEMHSIKEQLADLKKGCALHEEEESNSKVADTKKTISWLQAIVTIGALLLAAFSYF